MSLLHGFKGLIYVEGVSLDTHSASIQRQFQLNATITPSNATNQNIVWTSSNTNIATVEDGLVTPTGEGSVTITANVDGHTDSCILNVSPIYVTGVTLNESSITINAGEQEQLTATVNPSDASNPNITWSSSNTSVAVVDETGLVTYVSDGSCTITVTTEDGGYTDTCAVECVSFVPVDTCFGYTGAQQSITLKPHTYCIEVRGASGGTYGSAAGKGGYAAGCITLTDTTCLYIYIGGCGTYTLTNNGYNPGGWNGGGNGYNYSTSYIGPGGGGGTDVRIGGNTLYHRRIVAGGGGGGGCYPSCTAMCGGAGGGASGVQGGNYSSTWVGGTGGSQTAGGTNSCPCRMVAGNFGQGGYKTAGNSGHNGSGGGGGWYGGGAGSAVSAGGGGGSGYVYTTSTCSSAPSGYCHCTAYMFTGACCCVGNTTFPTATGGTETGHTGCGCVRIRSI